MLTSRQSGQALVETTLALGILLMVILGGVGILQVQMAAYQVQMATRAAAGAAALAGGPGSAANDAAKLILNSGMGTKATKATITVTCPEGCRRYRPITVRIVYRDSVWVPVPGLYDQFQIDHSTTRISEKDLQ